MFYVLLKADGSIDRYPYTLTDLIRANPGTSFAKTISDETAAAFNCYPVAPIDPPPEDHTVNLERTAIKSGDYWFEQWVSTPATPAQIAERTTAKANDIRAQRNQLLVNCDWTQLPDAPVNTAAWATYRQELRDISGQAGFPWNVTWPTEPTT